MKLIKFGLLVPTLLVSFCAAAIGQQFTVQVGAPSLPPTVLVNHTNVWRYHKGTNAPQAGWTNILDANLDATWGSGPGGFGYASNTPETTNCRTLLPDMGGPGPGHYLTFYLRRSFAVSSPFDAAAHLWFTNDFDDGFVAYLDGAEFTRFNAPGAVGVEPAYTTNATALHESSNGDSTKQAPLTYDLGLANSRLAVGNHILAVLGLNQATNSSDFIQIVDLVVPGGAGTATSGNFLAVVNTNTVQLSGNNTVAGSTRVVINGDDAAFSAGAWSKSVSLAPGVNKLFIAALDSTGALLYGTNYIVVSELSSSNISGTLPSSSTWSPAMGIIHLTGTAIVPPGGSLTIQPGTVVLASPGASILGTNATISALGTAGSRIYFLPSDGSTVWGEIAISGLTGTLLLQHIETILGHVEIFDGAVGTLEDSYFHDYEVSSPAIIHTLGSPNHITLNLRRCHVAHYYEVLSQIGTNHIEDCLMEYQGLSGDGIDFDGGQPGSYIRRVTVRRGLLTNTDALDMGETGTEYSHGVLIDSCLLHDMIDKGVSMGVNVDITVTNTLIYNVDTGIAVKDDSVAGIYNNTIADANYGYRCYNKANPAAPDHGGHITNSFNNILWHFTTEAYSLENGSTLVADYTDFYQTNAPGTGNFSSDPLFVNAAIHNYRVAGNSPTLGAGLGGANVGVTYPVGGIPGSPVALAAVGNGTNSVNLSWQDDADNETSFVIERSANGTSWTTIGSTGENVTTFSDTTGAAGTKFYYRVHATNTSGDSDVSNIASGTRTGLILIVAGGNVGGVIGQDTCWADNGVFTVTSSVTVSNGVKLYIKPGASVQFNSAVSLTVANGGTLLAVGTSNAPIQFTRSGASSWGGVTVNGAVGSPETHIEWANFAGNAQDPCIHVADGTVFFDHLTFSNTAASYIHVDGASFIIQNCVFPSATTPFELCHGTGGIKSGGHGIFQRNFFGVPIGYNDVVDFTGGNRPGPIIHFIDNVCLGATDDVFDLDGTDAWVEHNIFLHVHRNNNSDSASCVSSGPDSGFSSEITIIGNLMFDIDQAAMDKGPPPGFFTLINNTIVHQSHIGGIDPNGAVLSLADVGFSECLGMYMEGNIIADAERLVQLHTNSIVTFTNNIIATNGNWTTNLLWTGPGGNNSTNDPLFKSARFDGATGGWTVGGSNLVLITSNFTSWAQAQVMWDWFSLQTNSPGIGTGPNGLDKGGVIPIGASISGEPSGTTTQTNATLVVAFNRTGNAIPTTANTWPNGSGYTAYKWRLDTNAWSAETPIATPITLTGLADGPHYVEVSGKRDSGLYQDDLLFGIEDVVTRSRTWTVQTIVRPLILSASRGANSASITFLATAGQTYSVLYRDAFDAAHPWAKLPNGDVPDQGVTAPFTLIDNTATPNTRFYEIVTPSQP